MEGIEMRFYVYVHKTLDTGKVFYVGKGSGPRAYACNRRNDHWKNVYNKHGRTVEIVADNLTESAAFALERSLITQYGRDALTNKTDGGDGPAHTKQTEEKKERIRAFFRETGRLPSMCVPCERLMADHMRAYTSRTSSCYDADFRAFVTECRTKCGTIKSRRLLEYKEEIRLFYAENGRLPTETGDKEEAAMAGRMRNYCRPSSRSYDEGFRAWADAAGYRQVAPEDKKQAVLAFIATHKRKPYRNRPEEQRLGEWFRNFTYSALSSYDDAFVQKVRLLVEE